MIPELYIRRNKTGGPVAGGNRSQTQLLGIFPKPAVTVNPEIEGEVHILNHARESLPKAI